MGDGDCVWHGGAAADTIVMEENGDYLDGSLHNVSVYIHLKHVV